MKNDDARVPVPSWQERKKAEKLLKEGTDPNWEKRAKHYERINAASEQVAERVALLQGKMARGEVLTSDELANLAQMAMIDLATSPRQGVRLQAVKLLKVEADKLKKRSDAGPEAEEEDRPPSARDLARGR